jgi:TetR/AcrR family transcriptional repressor of nem operon
MRYGPEQKEQTRRKILESAARLFRRDGYQASGVDKVMAGAGLTAGGFYAHFRSKQDLLAESLTQAGSEMTARSESQFAGLKGREWVDAFLDYYLGDAHRSQLEEGCPLVALVSEIARADGPVKATFEGILLQLRKAFEANASGNGLGSSAERALAAIALCVGGLGLARSVQDPALASEILEACRVQASRMLTDGRRPKKST